MSGKLLLVDDDVELATLMREFFAARGFSLDACHNGLDGLRRALAGAYDLVLLDVMLPKLDGLSVLQRLRASSDVPVLMLTARTDQKSRICGLETGADDYLPKPFDPLELLARIRAVLRRVKASPTPSIEVGGVRLERSTRTVHKNGMPVEITTVEYEILDLLMSAAGRAVSRDEVAQRLYHRNATPLDRATDVHISHLRRKLDQSGVVIRTVRGVGYQLCEAAGEGE